MSPLRRYSVPVQMSPGVILQRGRIAARKRSFAFRAGEGVNPTNLQSNQSTEGMNRFQKYCMRGQSRRMQTETSTALKRTGENSTNDFVKISWWKAAMAIEQVVPNTGSIARDVLAAERTFLAWSRTGLGFVGAGSALFAAYHQEQGSKGVGCQRDKEDERVTTRGMHPRVVKKDQGENFGWSITDSRLENIHLYPTLAAALLVGNGAFLLSFATRRYLRTVSLMTMKNEPGFFPIDTKGTLLAIAVTASSSVVSLGLILSNTTRGLSGGDQGFDPAR
jgi:uncharacterized membrane protein YidH (DUF202 family)